VTDIVHCRGVALRFCRSAYWGVRCQRDGGNIEVCAGQADVAGWSFSPSAIDAYLRNLPNIGLMEPVRGLVESVIQSVRDSINDAS
jgi:hypothetical protein